VALEKLAALQQDLADTAEAAAAVSAAKAELEVSLKLTQAALQTSQDRCDAAEVSSASTLRQRNSERCTEKHSGKEVL